MAKRSVTDRESPRVPIMSRVTPDLRAKLDRSASEAGRSLAQELEFRLEQEFDIEQRLVALFGGDAAFRMFVSNASALVAFSRKYGKTDEDWFEIDDEEFDERVMTAFRDNLNFTMFANRPLRNEEINSTRERKPKAELPQGVSQLSPEEIGKMVEAGSWHPAEE